ncbi:hypothetical protein [Pajaroellobacter abortibovis]|uniref:Uncharacterized protein n=1 Tax=Pajaroellobacter abortibovis TaxID=1882918 RepID=A0A1L6MX30_9BACT|nr:hypothetical protein [Pajaroellobacter abortibovis]APS00103.1 hypothetical protein BCY86_04970 [Pajaroellobacter abortibovis]
MSVNKILEEGGTVCFKWSSLPACLSIFFLVLTNLLVCLEVDTDQHEANGLDMGNERTTEDTKVHQEGIRPDLSPILSFPKQEENSFLSEISEIANTVDVDSFESSLDTRNELKRKFSIERMHIVHSLVVELKNHSNYIFK